MRRTRCALEAVVLGALAATAATASLEPAPPIHVAPIIETAVTGSVGAGAYQYLYTIRNGLDANTAIVQLQFKTAGTDEDHAPRDWSLGPPAISVRANQLRSGVAPGQALNGLALTSQMLPGVTEAAVYGWTGPLAWDEVSPPPVRVPMIAPVIGSAKEQPLDAAVEILDALRDNIMPALLTDRDPEADRIVHVLHTAANGLLRRNLVSAELALQDLPVTPRDPGSRWRTALYDALQVNIRYVRDLIGRPDAVLDVQQDSMPSLFPDEWVTVEPGFSAPSTTDLKQFFAHTDIPFVGVLEHVSPEFVDAAKRDLRTRMVFRPTEWLKFTSPRPASPAETIEVWTRGGTYLDDGWDRTAPGPAAIAALRIGTACVVAASRFEKAGSAMNGQYWLVAPDTLGHFDGDRVRGPNDSLWVRAVVQQGRRLSGATDDVTSFLAALRHATHDAAK